MMEAIRTDTDVVAKCKVEINHLISRRYQIQGFEHDQTSLLMDHT